MSIAVLTQVYDETRRLAIAGSVVASGDFRLKKLIAPLEQAGAKAPVFAKAAQAVQGVVDSTEKTSAQSLMELSTLVNAVLYTQGETGLAGDLQPIETVDLKLPATPASARTLKPLIEALTTSGGGRIETIRDAFERGAFNDPRLLKPAIYALNDTYSEIADFMASKVLPLYGKAILPELKSKFSIQGKAAEARLLGLIITLDPEGSRALIKQVFDEGSKELRVAATQSLGAHPDDIGLLVEQVGSKVKEIREAAYWQLGRSKNTKAIEILKQAIVGKDLQIAIGAAAHTEIPEVIRFGMEELEREFNAFLAAEDAKAIAKNANRCEILFNFVDKLQDAATESFLLKAFARRDDVVSGERAAIGVHINNIIASAVGGYSEKTRQLMAKSHALLSPGELRSYCMEQLPTMEPKQAYDIFAPYLTPNATAMKKDKSLEMKRSGIQELLSYYMGGTWREDAPDRIKWDPRWLDLAVELKDLRLVDTFGRPGHKGANALLSQALKEAMKPKRPYHEATTVLSRMVYIQHPEAVDAMIAILNQKDPEPRAIQTISTLIPKLPKSAASKLEKVIAALPTSVSDELLEPLDRLKKKS